MYIDDFMDEFMDEKRCVVFSNPEDRAEFVRYAKDLGLKVYESTWYMALHPKIDDFSWKRIGYVKNVYGELHVVGLGELHPLAAHAVPYEEIDFAKDDADAPSAEEFSSALDLLFS